MEIVDIFVEEQTAKKPGRPVFIEMLKRIKGGKFLDIEKRRLPLPHTTRARATKSTPLIFCLTLFKNFHILLVGKNDVCRFSSVKFYYNVKNKIHNSKNAKKYREKLGISQDKLSKLAGITLHTITKIESGATSDPRIEIVKKIDDALGVSINDLMR